jgi:hypothetical protein
MISETTHAGDRARLRTSIARYWRRNGQNVWTDAEIDRAVEASLCRLQASTTPAAPESIPSQPYLLGTNATERETRAIAAASSFPSGPSRRERIAAHVASCGRYGATREDIAEAFDLPIQTVCPLVKSMQVSGRLVSTSRKRSTRNGRPAAVLITPENATGTGDRNR